MKRVQQGFTLIELMIVVAIIGIIVALAVPAYQDYTIRSRVSEGASLSAAMRTAIDVAVSEGYSITTAGGTIPTTNASLGLANTYRSKYVTSVTYLQNGVITVTLEATGTVGGDTLGAAQGGTIVYSPIDQGGNLQWIVASSSSVPIRYRPKP